MNSKIHSGEPTARAGVVWYEANRELIVALIAVLTIVATLLSGMPAASAKGGPGGGGNNGGGDTTSIEGLYGSDVAQAIGLEEVWALGYTGSGIDVAVIDTGVSPVVGLDEPGKVVDGPDFSFDSDDANLRHLDLHGHGTAMAGLVAGSPTGREELVGGNDFAVGAAPDARIVNVKVGDAVGAADVSQVIAAIDWVVQNRQANGMNIRVMLLAYDTDSMQDYQIDPLSYAVENAWRHGIVVVAAAGNDGRSANTLGNPATNPFVLAVGAAAPNGTSWKIPSWGSKGDGVRNPDVVVPGESILAPAVPGSFLANAHPDAVFNTPDGLMIRGNGTSQSAAAAAGAAAVLLEARPSLTPDEVKAAINGTAHDLGGKGAKNTIDPKVQGHGLVDLHPALDVNVAGATQTHAPSTGLGSLEESRGSYHVGPEGDQLTGELTAFGQVWDPVAWTAATSSGTAYTDQTWSGVSWSGVSWSGVSWSGVSWSGVSWSGVSWSGVSWSGVSWSGVSWSGVSWSGVSWSGVSWSGVSWSGISWS